jgi:WD40 repeat protein
LPSIQDPEYGLGVPLGIYAVEFGDNPNTIIHASGRSIKELDIAAGKVTIIERCKNCTSVTVHDRNKKAVLQLHQSSSNTVTLIASGEPLSNTVIAGNAINQPLSFSPDGMSLAYSTDVFAESVPLTNSQSFTATLFNTRVFVYKEREGKTYQTSSDAIFKPVWLNNETLLIPDRLTMRLWRLNVVTGVRDLYLDVGAMTHQQGRIAGLAFSPNGRYLVYQRFTDIFEDLYLLDLDCVRQSGKA